MQDKKIIKISVMYSILQEFTKSLSDEGLQMLLSHCIIDMQIRKGSLNYSDISKGLVALPLEDFKLLKSMVQLTKGAVIYG